MYSHAFFQFLYRTTETNVVRNSGYRQLLTISVQLEKATENRGDKFALIVVTFEVLLKYLEVQRLIISVFLTV